MSNESPTRRAFLQSTSGLLTGAALAGAISSRAYAGESNTIKLALVGCGGRGTGAAANALSTKGPTTLYAMADFFENRLQSSHRNLRQFARQLDVPRERQFVGLDAYRKAIDAVAPGGVVLLATPPAFRPMHVEYAVAKGCHVFMEKSFAVDAPGIRRVLKAGEEATRKNLKIAGGLRCRHDAALEEAVRQLQGGIAGDIITLWAYRVHSAVGFTPKDPKETELAHQIRNYSNFTWLNGSFFLDWLIHNIDICCWIKGQCPVAAQGQGARQTRTAPDQLFDEYAVEFTFADGTRMMAQGRHINETWGFFGVVVDGAKGSAVLGEGQPAPLIYRGHRRTTADVIWKHRGRNDDAYQIEHDLLFDAIRNDRPYNETDWSAKSAMAGIMGRMAAESGQWITWEQAMQSNLELAPGLDTYTIDSNPPAMPDAQGRYAIAMPGTTKVL